MVPQTEKDFDADWERGKGAALTLKQEKVEDKNLRSHLGWQLHTVKELAEAEKSVITYIQRRAFPAGIATLEMIPPGVHKGNKICRLDCAGRGHEE